MTSTSHSSERLGVSGTAGVMKSAQVMGMKVTSFATTRSAISRCALPISIRARALSGELQGREEVQ